MTDIKRIEPKPGNTPASDYGGWITKDIVGLFKREEVVQQN